MNTKRNNAICTFSLGFGPRMDCKDENIKNIFKPVFLQHLAKGIKSIER
jgi:hypothetical protein